MHVLRSSPASRKGVCVTADLRPYTILQLADGSFRESGHRHPIERPLQQREP
jgi:hypothetical protein